MLICDDFFIRNTPDIDTIEKRLLPEIKNNVAAVSFELSFDKNDLPTSNYYDDKPFSEGSYWWIKLSTCKYEEIQQANTVEAQKDILKSFLEKVIDLTIKLKAKDKDGTNF